MPKRKLEFFIMDIYISLIKIELYIKDIENSQDLLYDCKTWDAVMRGLEIIGEASKNLIENDLLNEDKRRIVDFRNLIVYHYFGIDKEIVWDILKYKLPELKIEIEGMINKIENKKEVIEFFIEDNLFILSVKKVLEKIKNEI